MTQAKFDCLNCLGICCAVYDQVPVTRRDVRRLARHFDLSEEAATRRFTKMSGGVRVLRRTRDPLLNQSCIFLDQEKRVCGIYRARPQVCREWPLHGDGGCVYYDLLQFERERQNDPRVVPLIQITSWRAKS